MRDWRWLKNIFGIDSWVLVYFGLWFGLLSCLMCLLVQRMKLLSWFCVQFFALFVLFLRQSVSLSVSFCFSHECLGLFVCFWFGWNGCELTMSHLNWLILNEDFLHDWPTMMVQLQPIFECYRKKIAFFATTRMLIPGLLYLIYTTHNTHTYVIGLVIARFGLV